jgi:hypothetical protein
MRAFGAIQSSLRGLSANSLKYGSCSKANLDTFELVDTRALLFCALQAVVSLGEVYPSLS